MDSQLDRLFSSLDSSFSAAIERDEEAAADDLAISLRQDQSLAQHLAHTSVSVKEDPQAAPVLEVGRDFVRTASGDLYPLTTTVFVGRPTGTPASPSDRYLVEVLRTAVREGSTAIIDCPQGQVTGLLLRCGPDHVSVRDQAGEVLIPLEAIRAVKLSRGG